MSLSQSQSVHVNVAPSSATAQAIAGVNNSIYPSPNSGGGYGPQGGGGGLPGYGAPGPMMFPGDGQSHGYGQGGHMMLNGGGGSDESAPAPPPMLHGYIFSPYNNGDSSTQQGGPVGPYFNQDANGAVARMYSDPSGGGGGGYAPQYPQGGWNETAPSANSQYDPYVYSSQNDPFHPDYDGGMIANPNGYNQLLNEDTQHPGESMYYGEPGFSYYGGGGGYSSDF